MSGPLAGRRIGLLTAAASRLGGGVFEAVVLQAQMIRDLGGEAVIFALHDRFVGADAARFGSSTVVTAPVVGPAQVGFAPSLLDKLLAHDLDCLHLHGIWMYPSRAALAWARWTGRRYVVSVHGMLDPWITARGRWKKALARTGYERSNWREATVLHALTQAEASAIAAQTGRTDSVVIANPAPPLAPPRRAMPPPRVLYLGRIHPKKNLASLIAGWSRVEAAHDARLILAGWGDGHDLAALRAAAAGAGPSVEFVGPVYGADKAALIASARFMVLPSLSEGLPMALLEAWAAGVPTIMTRACNLPEGFAAGAAAECGTDPESIAATLEQAMALDEPGWLAMSRRTQDLAATRFSAATVASQWIAAYGGEQ